jgi:GNAT superfamily N-acetyltransferase
MQIIRNKIQPELDFAIAIHLREVLRYIADISHLDFKVAGGYLALTTNKEMPGFNYIAGIGENAGDFIPLLDHLKQHTRSFTWFSYPLTPFLDKVLTQQGLIKVSPLVCVAYDLTQELNPIEANIEANTDFEVIPVTNASLFREWCQIIATTWNRTIDVTLRFYQGLNPEQNINSRMQFFLVRKDQRFVGCSLIDIQEDIAGGYWACVLPEFRRQGIGRLMVEKSIAMAKAQGCSLIVAQCVDSSLNICQQSGFKKSGSMALYRFAAP